MKQINLIDDAPFSETISISKYKLRCVICNRVSSEDIASETGEYLPKIFHHVHKNKPHDAEYEIYCDDCHSEYLELTEYNNSTDLEDIPLDEYLSLSDEEE